MDRRNFLRLIAGGIGAAIAPRGVVAKALKIAKRQTPSFPIDKIVFRKYPPQPDAVFIPLGAFIKNAPFRCKCGFQGSGLFATSFIKEMDVEMCRNRSEASALFEVKQKNLIEKLRVLWHEYYDEGHVRHDGCTLA